MTYDDVPQYHVLHWTRHAWNLPRDIGLPAAPSLGQMLEDGTSLVGTDAWKKKKEKEGKEGGKKEGKKEGKEEEEREEGEEGEEGVIMLFL